MLSDIVIAQAATLKPIATVANALDAQAEDLIQYGPFMAKLSPKFQTKIQKNPNGKLILVTAISPTPAGEGKTTTTIGLADALNYIGKKAIICLREPSLGPVFGIKGGATGGGYAQAIPMENINLHFTGDFHAITAANNLLAALVDNHIYHGNTLNIDLKTITWRRCMDMNDRALRRATLHQQRHETETGFDITVASEVMAIFCLAENLENLKSRLGEIQVAKNMSGEPILVRHLDAQGAMTVLLKDAFQPNLVQTIEHTPVIIHGGPFANIAHGCNSVVATKNALKLADYVITEAGFGADLGAEKFIDIKCRKANLQPDMVVIVATIRALKYHGGMDLKELGVENVENLINGISNLKRHINNLHDNFGLQVIVAINHFTQDTDLEVATLKREVEALGSHAIICKHWAEGGVGAAELAHAVVAEIEQKKSQFKLLYKDSDNLLKKIETIATKMYGAKNVELSADAASQLKSLEKLYNNLPICIAKTQYSFSSDAALRGAPSGHTLKVRELRLSRGAGFVVAICGDVMTMPGLPKIPASSRIDIDSQGKITGLS
ncbi:MAG: formate--tetrahydrofolate ligase [Methylophilaceae bacterium]